ncbi:serine hydrolase domain-containing protein [Sandaracinobacteroides saxicola]|uniref:serine hydrolase domain-containing protein n=1 Tax=Sandaracinobacteroides saxicola TaxID=2759707 RepID=UPI001FB0BE28|nr:serine hydrolase domain-containing protein [Sandaracinobacteroides saxicola]
MLLRALIATLLATPVLAAPTVATNPPLAAPTPETEAVYLQRFQAMASSRSGELPAYDPLEPVPGAAKPTPLPRGSDGIDPAALKAATDYAATQNSSSLLVLHRGRLVGEYYAPGRTAADTIVSKSLAKPLTALVVGRALMLGKVKSLDQPVADFITEWKGTPKAAILVRHLLDMRSGLLAQGFEPTPQSIWNRAYLHPNHDHVMVNDYPLTDPPGTRYEYSNVTSDLVALLIERATGRRYAEFVSTEILKPIGAAGGQVWLNRPGGLAHSGCCIMLPPESWARIAVLLANDGFIGKTRLLPAGYVTAMRTPTKQNPWYGLGVYVAGPFIERRGFANPTRPGRKVLHGEPYHAADLFLFDGNSNQAVWIVPSEQLVIVRTGEWGKRDGADEWDNSRIPNLIMAGITRKPGEQAPPPQPRDED